MNKILNPDIPDKRTKIDHYSNGIYICGYCALGEISILEKMVSFKDCYQEMVQIRILVGQNDTLIFKEELEMKNVDIPF